MLTPRQLIDLCRATDKPLPSGKVIAEVVERMEEERKVLARDIAAIGYSARLPSQHRVECYFCGRIRGHGHPDNCPLGHAERILKEGA